MAYGLCSANHVIIRDYAAVLPTAVKNWFWEPLSPSLTLQRVLFSKPNFLIEGMIAQIWVKSKFSPDFGIPILRRPDVNWLGFLRPTALRYPGSESRVSQNSWENCSSTHIC